MNSRHVTLEDQAEAARLTLDAVRFAPDDIVDSLESSNVDHMGALAVSGGLLFFCFLSCLMDTGSRNSTDECFEIGSHGIGTVSVFVLSGGGDMRCRISCRPWLDIISGPVCCQCAW